MAASLQKNRWNNDLEWETNDWPQDDYHQTPEKTSLNWRFEPVTSRTSPVYSTLPTGLQSLEVKGWHLTTWSWLSTTLGNKTVKDIVWNIFSFPKVFSIHPDTKTSFWRNWVCCPEMFWISGLEFSALVLVDSLLHISFNKPEKK